MQIRSHGSREGAIKHIRSLKPEVLKHDGPANPEVEKTHKRRNDGVAAQFKAATDFIISEINLLEPEFNGVLVDASFDFHEGGRIFQVNIIPQKLQI